MQITRAGRLLTLTAGLAFTLAACGSGGAGGTTTGGDTTTTGGAGGGTTIVAQDVAFDVTELSASAGSVTITFDNADDGISHNIHVLGDIDQKTEITAGPVTQELTFDAQPGTYEFRCDAHPTAMKGTLTVT